LERTGTAKLPLHYGKAPRYLVVRMQKLAREIVSIIVEEYGSEEFLNRISDPFWFQALGCVLGYDWHSSGVTTVITSVLKHAIIPEEHGIAVCGGKGRASRLAPQEICVAGQQFDFTDDRIESMKYASKMSAKVDNTAVQAGYQLYHHAFFLTEHEEWAVVQQGMCAQDCTARRYHWLSERVKKFVVEPHNAIVGDTKRQTVLDMTAKESEGSRRASVDLVKESPRRLMRLVVSARPEFQKPLSEWIQSSTEADSRKKEITNLSMPWNINWKTMQKVYEFQPKDYEELLSFRGVGPAAVRGLILIAELVYGEKPSWKDPVRYSFAYGGKDGVPFPVDRRAMDDSIQILRQSVQEARIGDKEKLRSLQRLRRFVPRDNDQSI
jgi:hypothetical protein